jgi:hypothetical protein
LKRVFTVAASLLYQAVANTDFFERRDERELKWAVCLCILQGGILALDQDDGHDFHRDSGPGKLDRSRGVSFGDDDRRI